MYLFPPKPAFIPATPAALKTALEQQAQALKALFAPSFKAASTLPKNNG